LIFRHVGIAKLVEQGFVKFVTSSNHDNLHVKGGTDPEKATEIFGNLFIEKCIVCKTYYRRKIVTPNLKRICDNPQCKGKLMKIGVFFGQPTPQDNLSLAEHHASKADLAIVFGSSMTVNC
jgi:NAD-dependent SIR2 family protein deacetylase